MPSRIHQPGKVGIISRSGTLTYVAVNQITHEKLGQSTCIGIGGDPIIGTTFVEALELFRDDEQTEAVVMIGEIGGTLEEQAAAYIGEKFQQARRLLHRRPDGAARAAHGPCRGDHLRRQRHGRREDGGSEEKRRARGGKPGRDRRRR